MFSSHSLRLRDDVYYDATFNKTYDAADAFIQEDVDARPKGGVKLMSSGATLTMGEVGYGTWGQWKTSAAAPASALTPLRMVSTGTGASIRATTTRTMLGVVVSANVDLEQPGTYIVRALLGRPESGDESTDPTDWIPAARQGSTAFSDRHVTIAAPGSRRLSFSFGYPAIEAAAGAGRHTYRIEVFDHRSGDDGTSMETRLIADFRDSVDVTQAQLDGAKGADIIDLGIESAAGTGDEGQPPRSFVARYTLSIPPPDPGPDSDGDLPGPPVRSYTLQARLARYSSFESLSYAGAEYELEEGEHTVSLEIPLPAVADPPAVEHFELTTELIANRDGYWYEDSVAFRRFSLDLSEGEVRSVEQRDVLNR